MSFEPETVQANRPDGYGIEAFPFKVKDKIPFLIGYGLGTNTTPSEIEMFLNPYNPDYPYVSFLGTRRLEISTTYSRTEGGWDKRTIATLEFPVACKWVIPESPLVHRTHSALIAMPTFPEMASTIVRTPS